MNLGSAPVRILLCQPSDEPTNLLANPWTAARLSGTPTPVKTESSAVPADNRLGFDDDQHLAPARPHPTKCGPEQTVQGVHGRPRSLALEHSNLLSQSEDFQSCVGSTAEEDSRGGD